MPWTRSLPRDMVSYMVSNNQQPIMTQSDSVTDLGANAYGKPSAAYHLLRDTIIGRERFDFALKEYARRWKFKRPTPADFFRTMEDASGVDLDWFWRGWFYGVDHVDVSVDEVRWLQLDTRDPAVEKPKAKAEREALPKTLSRERNASVPKRVDRFPELKDFYDGYDEATVLPSDKKKHEALLKELAEAKIDPQLLRTEQNLYVIELSNVGGLVTPVPLRLEYTDGTHEELRLPAEIWRFNTEKTSKVHLTPKELRAVVFDPRQELMDADVENNFWPRRLVRTKLQLFKDEKPANPMRELTKPEPAPANPAAKK
jgi:hypothetical protein